MQVVRLGSERSAIGWKFYDEQYRLRKAHDPASLWSQVDSELWLFYMQGGYANQSSYQNSNESLHQNPLKCYAFNYSGRCYKQGCNFSHTCLNCGGSHSLKICYYRRPGNYTGEQRFRFPNRQTRPSYVGGGRGLISNFGFRPQNNYRPRTPTAPLGQGVYSSTR